MGKDGCLKMGTLNNWTLNTKQGRTSKTVVSMPHAGHSCMRFFLITLYITSVNNFCACFDDTGMTIISRK